MSVSEWVGVISAISAIIGGFVGAIGWLVKHYLSELRPNSGNSMNDRVTRMENALQEIWLILVERD